jgi:adenylate kinase family enzyme
VKRISVLGSPGAGKTTLSNKLAVLTGLPVYHLDKYYLEKPEYWDGHNPEWIESLKDIYRKDKWIIDGNYSKTFEERFERSDLIVFLDVSRIGAYRGVIKRRIKYRNKARPEMPEGWQENLGYYFLKQIWQYHYKSNKQANYKYLEKYINKLIIVKNKNDLDKLIQRFK